MGGCLASCCCTEAGLRCHSVLSLCGAFYFIFMFLLFDRQSRFFEFYQELPKGDAKDNTKWSLLIVSIIWLVLFVVSLLQLHKVKNHQEPGRLKNKITIADVRAVREDSAYERLEESSERNLR